MLAVALHNLSIVEDVLKNDDGSEWHDGEEAARGPTHLSITLPCKPFKDSFSRYNISVSNELLHRLLSVHHQCAYVQNAISPSRAHPNVIFLINIPPKQIIFMDDLPSRCFIGILSPSSLQGHSPRIIEYESGRLTSASAKDDHGEKDRSADSHRRFDVNTKAISIPHGIMLRLQDDLMCRLIFDSE
jgi:hypothetical protein